MDNVNQPPGPDPREHPPTQPYQFTPGWPGSNAYHGQNRTGPQDQPGPEGQYQYGPQDQYGPHGQYGPQGTYQTGPEGQYGQYGSPGPYQDGQYQGDPYHSGQHQAGSYQGGPYQGGPYGQYQDGTPYQPGMPYQPGQPQPGRPPRPRGPVHKKLRWTAGITAAVLLAAGGTLIGLKLTGSASPAAPANSASATALNTEISSLTGAAACRQSAQSGNTQGSNTPGSNTTGSSSSSNASSAGTSGSNQPARARCRVHRLHVLRLIRGMYGQVSYNTPSGTRTLAFERGTIQSVSNGQLSVKAKNGTTWTWAVASSSVIRENSKSASSTDLLNGDSVFVAGQVSGSTKDARVVIVHPRTGSSSGGSQGSSSKTSSTSAAA